ncbi:hypothetical protein BGX38DRAFT_1183991 [Terfezia claveryi]|nr:hypothetical protein BGX38DRAFT_1183991 [Terfezia claveryi]
MTQQLGRSFTPTLRLERPSSLAGANTKKESSESPRVEVIDVPSYSLQPTQEHLIQQILSPSTSDRRRIRP